MNGHIEHEQQPPKVWQSLVKTCLPPQNRDVEFWWNLTGYHLAKMIEEADYPIERQYEILLFHYHWIVPRLGAAPEADGLAKWKSLMAHDGSPLEYSWKWNTTTTKPEVRYSWEAFNPGSDSCLNPKNHALSLEYMRDVPIVAPNVDFTWSRHFLNLIEQGDRPACNFLHAVEYHRSEGIDLKSYFMPRNTKLLVGGESSTQQEWDDAIAKLDPDNGSHRALKEFLANNAEGKELTPAVLAWDNVAPSQSRLKWYFICTNTSFAALREIMTLGGLLDVAEDKLQDLRSLITTVCGVPEDYPEDTKFPAAPPVGQTWLDKDSLVECFVFFFDIAPRHGSKPDVKFYLPTRRYGPDDRTISHRMVDWMKSRGRGDYGDAYLRMMEAVAEHRGLDKGKGLHSYISYQFSKTGGEPDIKSYLTPETYHPARFPEASKQ